MNDELFERMNAIDPATAPVTPHDGPAARLLRETIMNNDIHTDLTSIPPARHASRRRPILIGGVGLAAAAAAVVGVATLGGSSSSAPTTLAASLAPTDPMAMCAMISEYQPSATSSAFGGTVIAVTDTTVTVEVDRWYQNGDADQVEITVSDTGMIETGIEGTALVEGADLLVTVIDGQVQTCGISGGSSPEMVDFYETWYG